LASGTPFSLDSIDITYFLNKSKKMGEYLCKYENLQISKESLYKIRTLYIFGKSGTSNLRKKA
jgi:hypothetical protein